MWYNLRDSNEQCQQVMADVSVVFAHKEIAAIIC